MALTASAAGRLGMRSICNARPNSLQIPRMARVVCASVRESTAVQIEWVDHLTRGNRPQKLEAILRVLQAQGHTVAGPSMQKNLHPFFIPLTTGSPVLPSATEPEDCSTIGDHVFVGLLAWPDPSNHKDMEFPVVSMSVCAPSVRLLSRSVDEYLHRVLAIEDALEDEQRSLANAAGEMGLALYKPGTVASLGMTAKLEVYLTTKAGKYCDMVEQLVYNHLAKGDQMSSLITGEWYMRGLFDGWGRPYEFNAQRMLQCGHIEEARDTARMALRMPWWSLQQGYAVTAQLAELSGTPNGVFAALNDEGRVKGQSVAESRSTVEAALLKADLAMNLVSASGIGMWDEVRSELADCYRISGCRHMERILKP